MKLRLLFALVACAVVPLAMMPLATAGAQEAPDIPQLTVTPPPEPDAKAMAELIRRLPDADVVALGEVHDNPLHHVAQARAVRALEPRALVFEMLSPEQALAATSETRIDAGTLGAALGWDTSGWPDFAMYFPIFAAAPSARVYGAAVPRDRVRDAVSDGALAVFTGLYGSGAGVFGLDQPLPPAEQQAREALQQTAHCDALPAGILPGMVEAQRLRDAALARAVVKALDEVGPPVAVIAGTGHVRRDWGVPALLQALRPGLRILAVGQGESDPPAPDDERATNAEGTHQASVPARNMDSEARSGAFDLWITAPPAPREDPCLAFR